MYFIQFRPTRFGSLFIRSIHDKMHDVSFRRLSTKNTCIDYMLQCIIVIDGKNLCLPTRILGSVAHDVYVFLVQYVTTPTKCRSIISSSLSLQRLLMKNVLLFVFFSRFKFFCGSSRFFVLSARTGEKRRAIYSHIDR